MDVIVGLVPGQRRKPSALCVVEYGERREGRRRVDHFRVHHLEELPMGSSYPAVARRTAEVVGGVHRKTGDHPQVFLDATGLGEPVVELIQQEIPSVSVRAVYFNHGDRRSDDGGVILLGKAWLVTRLQTLLQASQIHLPRHPEAEELAQDLVEFEISLPEDANDPYGAFRVGRRDQLVTALGLAVQKSPERWELH